MKQQISAIEKILNDEIKLHQKILETTYQKRKYILFSKTEDLEKLHQVELSYLDEIKKLELGRFEKIKEIKKLKSIAEGDIFTIEDLIEIIPKEKKNKISKLRQKLISLVKQISSLNRRNGYLLNKAIDFISEKLSHFTKSISHKDKYSRNLTKKMNYSKGNFLNSRI